HPLHRARHRRQSPRRAVVRRRHAGVTPAGMKVLGILLAASILSLAWMCGGGPAGLGYLAIYALAVAPGLPIGIVLFGRTHAAAFICGALLGYGLTQLTIWAVIVAGLASAPAFVAAWAVLTVATWGVSRLVRDSPAVPVHAW